MVDVFPIYNDGHVELEDLCLSGLPITFQTHRLHGMART